MQVWTYVIAIDDGALRTVNRARLGLCLEVRYRGVNQISCKTGKAAATVRKVEGCRGFGGYGIIGARRRNSAHLHRPRRAMRFFGG